MSPRLSANINGRQFHNFYIGPPGWPSRLAVSSLPLSAGFALFGSSQFRFQLASFWRPSSSSSPGHSSASGSRKWNARRLRGGFVCLFTCLFACLGSSRLLWAPPGRVGRLGSLGCRLTVAVVVAVAVVVPVAVVSLGSSQSSRGESIAGPERRPSRGANNIWQPELFKLSGLRLIIVILAFVVVLNFMNLIRSAAESGQPDAAEGAREEPEEAWRGQTRRRRLDFS